MCPLLLGSLGKVPVGVCLVEIGLGGCAVLGEVFAAGASRAMQHVRSKQKACLIFPKSEGCRTRTPVFLCALLLAGPSSTEWSSSSELTWQQ